MALAKESPRSGGADRGQVLQVEALAGKTNYSKLRDALQDLPELAYAVDNYKQRTPIDDWFSVYGLTQLSKPEYFVLRFIVARTIHYGKTSEIIFKSHFIDGVVAGGEWKAAPCGVNSRDLYAALDSLEQRGIVTTRRIQTGKRHLATLYTVHVDTLLSIRGKPKMALKVPKRLKNIEVPNGTAHDLGQRCQMAPKNSKQIKSKTNSDDVGCAPVRRIRRTRAKLAEDTATDCKAKVEEVIRATTVRTATKQLEKVRRGRAAAPSAISLTDLNATWKQACIEEYGRTSVVGLSHKEYGIFKRVIKPHELAMDWLEFFRWVLRNWTTVNESHAERREFAQRKNGTWLGNGQPPYLGTTTPSLISCVMSFAKLLKLYVDREHTARRTPSVSDLQRELEATKRKLAEATKAGTSTVRLTDYSRAAIAAPESGPHTRPPAPVDDLDYDDELPIWGAEA